MFQPEAPKSSHLAIVSGAGETTRPPTQPRPGRPKRKIASDIPEVTALLTWIQDLLRGPPYIRYEDLVHQLGYKTRSSVGRLLNGDSPPPDQAQLISILRYVAARRERRNPSAQEKLFEQWQQTALPLCRAANEAAERRKTLLRKSAQQLADELEHERHNAVRLQQRLDTLEKIIKTMPDRVLESGTPAESTAEREALAAELDRARRREENLRTDLQRAQSRVRELEEDLAKLRIRYQAITVDAEVSVLALERAGDSPVDWLDQLPPLRADLPDPDHDLLVKLRSLLQGVGATTESLVRNLAAPPATVAAMLTGEHRLGWADIERVTTAAGVTELRELRLLYGLCPRTSGCETCGQQPQPAPFNPGTDGPAPVFSTDPVHELQNNAQDTRQSSKRFRRRPLRRGYEVDDVDAFLDLVEATLAGEPIGAAVTAEKVHYAVFRERFGGYDEWQVDQHLDQVEQQLAELEERRNHGRPDIHRSPTVDPGTAPRWDERPVSGDRHQRFDAIFADLDAPVYDDAYPGEVGARPVDPPDRMDPPPGMDRPARTELRYAEFIRISRELKYIQSMAAITREQLATANRDRDAVLAALPLARIQPQTSTGSSDEQRPQPAMPTREPPAGLTLIDRPTDEYLAVRVAWEDLRTALASNAALTTILGHSCDLDDPIDVGRLSAHVPADDVELLPIVWRLAEIRSWCTSVDTSKFSGNIVSTGYLVPSNLLAELFTRQCADITNRAKTISSRPTEPYLATSSRAAADTSALVGHRRRAAPPSDTEGTRRPSARPESH